MSGPKIRFTLDFEHCWPALDLPAKKDTPPSQGHSFAKVCISVKIPRSSGDYSEYEADAEIARGRFEWIPGEDSSSVEHRAADWVAESLAKMFATQWEAVASGPVLISKLRKYMEDTFSKLSQNEIEYSLQGKSRAINLLRHHYAMSYEAAVAKIEEAYAFASQRE